MTFAAQCRPYATLSPPWVALVPQMPVTGEICFLCNLLPQLLITCKTLRALPLHPPGYRHLWNKNQDPPEVDLKKDALVPPGCQILDGFAQFRKGKKTLYLGVERLSRAWLPT